MDLQNINTIVSLLVLIITYLIVQPLRSSIDALKETVKLLAAALEKQQDVSTAIKIAIAELDQRARSAHNRLDDFSDRLVLLEKKCNSCTCKDK